MPAILVVIICATCYVLLSRTEPSTPKPPKMAKMAKPVLPKDKHRFLGIWIVGMLVGVSLLASFIP